MYVLFYIRTGTMIKTYKTEGGARTAMRTSNRNAGFGERMGRCWTAGYEYEWCRGTKGAVSPIHTYGPAPYGIAPMDSWQRYVDKLRYNTDESILQEDFAY